MFSLKRSILLIAALCVLLARAAYADPGSYSPEADDVASYGWLVDDSMEFEEAIVFGFVPGTPFGYAPTLGNPMSQGQYARTAGASWSGWLGWWSNFWSWIGNWWNIATDKINAVRDGWKRSVLWQGYDLYNSLRNRVPGDYIARRITDHYRSRGLYCPDRPWWLSLPDGYKPAWPILTCAEYAR